MSAIFNINKYIILCGWSCLNLMTGFQAIGQSFDVSFQKVLQGDRFISYEFEVPSGTQHEFMAFSVRLEGKNIGQQDTKVLLNTPSDNVVLQPYHEAEDNPNLYISNMIYLTPENAGRMTLWVEGIQSLSRDTLKGYIRIFIPQESGYLPVEKWEEDLSLFTEAECACPQPQYMGRSQWGSQFGLTPDIYIPPAAYTQVSHLIVHHSAGTNVSQNWPAVVASIFDFHVNTNRWQDIGYNWLIDPEGTIYEGRGGGDNVRGAHMCGYNNNTLGVCLLGNFELYEPSEEAVLSLERLLSWKACLESINPEGIENIVSHYGQMYNISGHQEGCRPGHTACPGKFLFSKLPQIRSYTSNYIETQCEEITSVSGLIPDDPLFVYPNPTNGQLCLNFSHLSHIVIHDIMGKEYHLPVDQNCVDITSLEPGTYVLTVEHGHSKIRTRVMKI